MNFTEIDERTIRIIIDRNVYSSEVVHKCFYWYADKYAIEIQSELNSFVVTICSLLPEVEISQLLNKVKSDLIDFKTREIIVNETKHIREILIAKAFARGDEFDQPPPGDIADPVGFDPYLI